MPEAAYSKLAKFLEANNHKEMAFKITPDNDTKFELALQLNKVKEAAEIAEIQENTEKFKKVGDMALMSGDFELAEKSFIKGDDLNSLFLFYSSYGDEQGMKELCAKATEKGRYNVAFQAAFIL